MILLKFNCNPFVCFSATFVKVGKPDVPGILARFQEIGRIRDVKSFVLKFKFENHCITKFKKV